MWVYNSLSNFNVDAKLKCGQDVEIIERVPNYVKIRTQNGVEGFVPDAAIVNLSAFQPYHDGSHDVGLAAKRAQASEMTKAAANAAELAPPDVNYSKLMPRTSSTAAPASVSIATAPALGVPRVAPTASPRKSAPKTTPKPASNPKPAKLSNAAMADTSARVTVAIASASSVPAAPEKLALAMAPQPSDSTAGAAGESVATFDGSGAGQIVEKLFSRFCAIHFVWLGVKPYAEK